MKININKAFSKSKEEGIIGWALLWWMGIPVSILLILFLVRGCT